MTSTIIYNKKDFRPTYLYIKKHKTTNKMYFGMHCPTSKDSLKSYKGSGVYWKHHLQMYGKNDIETI